MTAAKKVPIRNNADYRLAAAQLRARLAASNTTIDGEILPIDGVIHVMLGGKPIPRRLQDSLFGLSAIDIPEFREARRELD
jgi:hypothetical protein